MRSIWGMLGLIVVVAVVALLARQHLGGVGKTMPPTAAGQGEPVKMQSRQIERQVRQALDAAMASERNASVDQ